MPDIFVHLIDFPRGKKVHEAVTPNEDGSYSVFIDARLSAAGQIREYEHALKHIEAGDFEKADVQLIEAAAHGQTLPPKEVRKWRRGVDAALTRAHNRHERAAMRLGMDYYDYMLDLHDRELFEG